jgi:dienelactone hydrolase
MRCEFDPRNPFHWPDREELGVEFARVLGSAQEGGSTVSECFLTAARIDLNDRKSWRQEWQSTANISHERGNKALDSGHLLSAKSNWLRAINYYQAAAIDFDASDANLKVVLQGMRKCAHLYLQHSTPAGEVVEIPWLDGYVLEGYFLPSPNPRGRSPVVICMGEPGHRKEEYLCKSARYAMERGMSLLAVDLLGPDGGFRFHKIVGRSDLETAVQSVMDFVVARHDVDEDRIAILGDGGGSSFVARGIAHDPRFAVAVCDGGIWDMLERDFLKGRLSSRDASDVRRSGYVGVAQTLKCPVLVTLGAHGWLEPATVEKLLKQIKTSRQDISLKIFSAAETASWQGHLDNPSLASEYIFDWIADRLGNQRSSPSPASRNPPQPLPMLSQDDS